jgi:hypothetical protein
VTFYGTDARAGLSIKERASFFATLLIPLLLVCAGSEGTACAQRPGASAPIVKAPMSQKQVVDNLVAMDLKRAHELNAFQGTQLYRLEYHGFGGTHSAEMTVDVKYRSPDTKEFTIRSATGSELIIRKVFKKLLQAEKEAMEAGAQRRDAMNNDNYDFTLMGYNSTPSGSMYVLGVKPKTKGLFLYRGQIWVDAEGFAVARLEAQPARNPSFWITHIEIEEVYKQVGDFWLPVSSHSIAKIRFGGRAVLTIQYQNYEITSADAVSNLR